MQLTNNDVRSMTLKQYLTSITVIFGALLMGMILFSGVTYFLNQDKLNSNSSAEAEQYLIIVCITAVTGVIASTFVAANLIKNARTESTLWSKLLKYRTALIVKYALIEGPVLFALVIFLITAHLNFLAIAALLIGIFVVNMPTKSRLIKDLQLSPNDVRSLESMEELT